MRALMIAAGIVMVATVVFGQQQQQADPVFMQHAIQALQEQRNQALDSQAATAARLKAVSDDLTKAQARIQELEKPATAQPPPQKNGQK